MSPELEDRFLAMANAAPVLLWMARTDGYCDFFNQPWLDFTGRSLEEEWGVGWAEGIHFEDFQRCMDIYNYSFSRRMPFEMEYRLRNREGEFRWISDRGVPRFAQDGSFLGYIGSCIDITERKLVENEIRQSRQAAFEASILKSQFMANMSHEIRTPLNGILGIADLLLVEQMTPEQNELVKVLKVSSEQLLKIVNQLLDFSTIESGRMELVEEQFSLSEVVGNVVALLRRSASKNAPLLDPIFQSSIRDQRLLGDLGKISQVLTNLIANAIKFTEKGSIQVSVVSRPLNGIDDRVLVTFEIEDTGIGIPTELQDRIFRPFSQVDGSTARKYEGTGLGLVISKKIVAFLGGEIGFSSRPQVGSKFWFTLPLTLQSGV